MEFEKWLQKYSLQINDFMLIKNAFYHSSYANENKDCISTDNERLEFVGDAVLQFWSATFLYNQKPEISEGNMTLLRSQLVNESALADFSRQLELGQFLKLGQGELKSNGKNRDSILADLFEAFIGALYLDGGMDNVNKIMDLTIRKTFIQINQDDLMDYKTKLQEYVQSDKRKTVFYEIISTSGPANNPTFVSVVKLDDLVLGKGIGSSKKKSQQQAAKDALEKLAK
ncbi:MAG: ribonuclease III [Erysipelothrix sp.]|nr:ribonuclease III [Erysipelothrix sp.]